MTIKAKLTLNIVLMLVVVCVVASASVTGMTFVKNSISYLTQQSTPFQMRTLELQRALEAATAALMKVGAAASSEEYRASRSAAVTAIEEVQTAERALSELSTSSRDVASELRRQSEELFSTMERKIRAEEEAVQGGKTVTERVASASRKLEELDTSIKTLLQNRQSAFAVSMESARKSRLPSAESNFFGIH